MYSEEDLKHRIRNAVILLNDGHPLNVGNLTLGARDKNLISVSGETVSDFDHVTEKSARDELERIKAVFASMVDLSDELKEFIKSRKIEYNLFYNYGMGDLLVCSEKEGQIEWGEHLKLKS